MGRRRGFTLVELVIVIAMLAILLTLLLPSLRRAVELSRRTKCLSNMRQLGAAYFQYAAENDGQLLACDSQTAQAGLPNSGEDFVIPALSPYAGDPRIFHCANDDGYYRVAARTYAINDYLGGTYPRFRHAHRLKDVSNAPSTFLFIEDTPPPDKGGTGGFVVLPYPSDRWADVPGFLHNKGTCISFADGHGEWWQWLDPRTTALLPSPVIPIRTTDNPDLVRLQQVEGFGKAPEP